MDSYLQLHQCNEPINITSIGNASSESSNSEMNLVPVSELPMKYQPIFHSFPYFNIVQSNVFEDVAMKYQPIFHSFPYFNIVQSNVFEDAIYTDKPIVVCAPTGSGKTAIFELCIVRLLILVSELKKSHSQFKIVYMAPVKSLCNERFIDWKKKFEPLGVLCIQLTGDSEREDYFELQKYSLIFTTPEKWDSVTRLWKNNKCLVQMVKLFLIDEIHLLNEEERGATMEAALSRMKTIQFVLSCDSNQKASEDLPFRFIAASATFPNAEDAANWLSSPTIKGIFYKFSDNLRPVCLKKIVIGYPCSAAMSEFKFDLMLSYKLSHVIQTYSEKKPTLVFCATRKSAIQTAITLSKTAKFVINANHKVHLIDAANRLHESTLRECVLNGIGFHHGGLDVSDRRLIETMFLTSQLLVLISTSTLSMGVNFPAHLVVLKSTSQYAGGCYKEYSDTQIFQMIGRAGRPQFDRNATAVIMTKSSLQFKYESLINGTQLIESNLHKHMVEHLNAEIVLGAISDISIVMEWLKATYLYQRIFKNPEYYGMNADLPKDKIERKLQDICISELNGLRKYQLIYMDDDSFYLRPTKTGHLMAKYYIAYETMKKFYSLTGNENLSELITVISSIKEFDDINLRVSEKKCLNELNKSKVSSIRFPLQGKIKTKQMKINCLIQATFGSLTVSESSLNQDVSRIFRNGQRVSKCLVDYLSIEERGFSALYNAVILTKCFKAKLWENSKHVSRQLERIGIALSTLLVNAGITTFHRILQTNPREMELILKRNPPFGTLIIESARKVPRYSLQVEQSPPTSGVTASIYVTITLENIEDVQNESNTDQYGCYLLIGDADNKILSFNKIRNTLFLKKQHWFQKVDITRAQKRDLVNIYVINDTFVGLDIHRSYSIIYDIAKSSSDNETQTEIEKPVSLKHMETNSVLTSDKKFKDCNHRCLRKDTCSHECCKTGVKVAVPRKSAVSNIMEQIQNKNDWQPSKKVKIGVGTFTQNVKMFPEKSGNDVSINYDLAFQKNWGSKKDNIFSHQNGVIPRINSTALNYTSQYEEKQQDNSDVQNDMELKSDEENDLHDLSFDVSFKDCTFEEKLLDECEQSQKVGKNMENVPRCEIYPERINMYSKYKRKIEKWEDPIAAEETFNMCLNFLLNSYEIY